MAGPFDAATARLDALAQGQAQVLARVGALETGQAQVLAQLGALGTRVGTLETGQAQVLAQLGVLAQGQAQILAQLAQLSPAAHAQHVQAFAAARARNLLAAAATLLVPVPLDSGGAHQAWPIAGFSRRDLARGPIGGVDQILAGYGLGAQQGVHADDRRERLSVHLGVQMPA